MDDEKLIAAVEKNECLYNKHKAGYKLPEKKKNIWRRIGQEMGESDEDCIRRWTTLRDRYARECKKRNASSGSGASSYSQWPLMEAMSFLKRHLVPRPVRSNIALNEELISVPLSPMSPISSFSPLVLMDELSAENSQSPGEEQSPVHSTAARKAKKRTAANIDEAFIELVDVFKNQVARREKRENLVLQGFGSMIMAAIEELSAESQAIAIQRCTEIVMGLKASEAAINN